MADGFTESWHPDFKPGWPDILPIGLIVGQLQVRQRRVDGDVEMPEEDDLRWTLHGGVTEETPRLAFLGDLTVRNPLAFAGVSVIMPFVLRDEPEEITSDFVDDVLRQYGEWASSVMYDYAASNLRSGLAGNGLPLDVPFGTPPVTLHTAEMEEPAAPRGDT